MLTATQQSIRRDTAARKSEADVGLELLAGTERLRVKQELEPVECLASYKNDNHFAIVNDRGKKIFYATEKSSKCARKCCGGHRPFDITVMNLKGRELMHCVRPMRFCGCLCCIPWCRQQLQVKQNGVLLGSLRQNLGPSQSFSVRSASGKTQLIIRRRCCAGALCCTTAKFKIKSANGRNDVGLLTKQYRYMLDATEADADVFTVQFPRDMDISTKATLLGGSFLIDYLYFEEKKQKERCPAETTEDAAVPPENEPSRSRPTSRLASILTVGEDSSDSEDSDD